MIYETWCYLKEADPLTGLQGWIRTGQFFTKPLAERHLEKAVELGLKHQFEIREIWQK